MDDEPEHTVICGRHGPNRATFVCRHILESLRSGVVVGFHTPDGPHGDEQAWCDACERIRAGEGEWNDRSEAFAEIQLLCARCFARAISERLMTGMPDHPLWRAIWPGPSHQR